jgi:citrate lyase subunit beta/citryl-CoA lyase
MELANRLDEIEQRLDIPLGSTQIMPIATETAVAVLALASDVRCGPRLAALTWGAEDLSVQLGALTSVDQRGDWLPPYQLARSLCLLAAAAAGVAAVDTIHTELRDTPELTRQARAAWRDGFVGKLAIHPEQVEVFNREFRPAVEEVAAAQRVVEAFQAAAGAGTVSLDGRMLDRPHLVRARRTLWLAVLLEGRDKPSEMEVADVISQKG